MFRVSRLALLRSAHAGLMIVRITERDDRMNSLLSSVGIISSLLVTSTLAQGISVTPDELAEARSWISAKFEGAPPAAKVTPGLVVMANHDAVQRNARGGKPLRLGSAEHTRGLYCHAFSKIIVHLPGPGARFTAIAGVDTNDQTTGGRGSIEFSVHVGEREGFRSGVLREGTSKQVQVELHGADQFVLQVDETPDSIACDQADWAEAKVVLQDGTEVWLGDLPVIEKQRAPYSIREPFAFDYGGRPSAELLNHWKFEKNRPVPVTVAGNSPATQLQLTWRDPETGLEVRCVAVAYNDFPTVEWTLYFKNTSAVPSPVLSNIQALDTVFDRSDSGDFVLHHNKGTFVRPDDFEPLTSVLKGNEKQRFAPPAGRPCGHVWPYFNLEFVGEGVIVAVGWPGQWAAQFGCNAAGQCRVVAGQEKTNLKLLPGEEIRTPLMVLQFWRGDWLRAQNVWRRWMFQHNLPRVSGKVPNPLMPACSSHQFGEMINATEANQKFFVDRYLQEGLNIDYWWMDAGWYVNQSGWPNTGTWLVDSNRFPHGLRAISDHARAKGVKTLVWFEPERVTPGTWLHEHHPEWLLKGTLLNLGNTNAWHWLVEHIDKTLVEQGIDLYRQDYNIDPLSFWRETDRPDRAGITENHYITGYLAYWDELRRRHPDMLIDSCASGGHRNDLETMRRSLPFLRSDCIQDAVGNQGHTYGLSLWLPYHGTGSHQIGIYEYRSASDCPHFIACWDMRDDKLDYPLLRRLVNQWRAFAPNYYGDYYPLTPYNLASDLWIAWQFDRPETGEGMVQAFRRDQSAYESARFKLHGLLATAEYLVTNVDAPDARKTFRGSALMEDGLPVNIESRPGAVVYTYKVAKK
jgi:alpha-galactosidase